MHACLEIGITSCSGHPLRHLTVPMDEAVTYGKSPFQSQISLSPFTPCFFFLLLFFPTHLLSCVVVGYKFTLHAKELTVMVGTFVSST